MQNDEIEPAGFCDERFAGVAEAFKQNFVDRGEVGAAVTVMVDGEPLVDLWGGVADAGSADTDGTPWGQDTATVVFSCTKGATALCAHLLADRGELCLLYTSPSPRDRG